MKDCIITGVSWSWKTTVQLELIEKYGYTMLYNFSTREVRGEDGLDWEWDFTNSERNNYIFISPENLLKKYKNGDCSNITLYNGNLYAMSRVPVKENAPICVILEPNGRKQVEELWKKEWREHVTLFLNISPQEQEKRMRGRGESEEVIEKRKRDYEYFSPTNSDVVIECDGRTVEEVVQLVLNVIS